MIQQHSYYTVMGWMREELGLSGNELAIYAIIYGFSQDGASEYAGSSRYLAEWLGCSKRTVLTALANLTEKGHLVKRTTYQNGVTFCNYVAARNVQIAGNEPGANISPPVKNLHHPGEEFSPPPVKNLHHPGEEFSPHNTRDNTRYINKEINTMCDSDESTEEKRKPTETEIDKFFDSVWELYPVKRGKNQVKKKARRVLYDIGYDKIERAIARYKQELAAIGWKKPQNGSTFFNSGYADYLDENFTPAPMQQPRPAGRGYGAPAGNIGPNGVAIDQSEKDLSAIF